MEEPGREGGAVPATFDTSLVATRTGVLLAVLDAVAAAAAADRALAPLPVEVVFSFDELTPPPRRSTALYS